MPKITDTTPRYRRHRASGQAVVTLNAHDHYLGPYGSKASRVEYDRLIGEWLAAGRRLPLPSSDLSVAELAASYLRFARGYYLKAGRPTSTLGNLHRVIKSLRLRYGATLAADFGPRALHALQGQFVQEGLSRRTVNDFTAMVKRIFRWGTANELVAPAVHQALLAVEGLRKGRTAARESRPVLPVPASVVEATLPFLLPVVADMVRFQSLTGCRPGEVCMLRPCDLDRSGDVWAYHPEGHKTEHLGRERVVWMGPRAQEVLRPYLLRPADSCCFRPIDSDVERKATLRANRKTPVQPSQRDRSKRNPKRQPGERYTTNTYNRAITRAVEKANEAEAKASTAEGREPVHIPRWHVNQLRHTVATAVRHAYGLEAAQVILGHAKADVTQLYAERNAGLAAEIMRKIG